MPDMSIRPSQSSTGAGLTFLLLGKGAEVMHREDFDRFLQSGDDEKDALTAWKVIPSQFAAVVTFFLAMRLRFLPPFVYA